MRALESNEPLKKIFKPLFRAIKNIKFSQLWENWSRAPISGKLTEDMQQLTHVTQKYF